MNTILSKNCFFFITASLLLTVFSSCNQIGTFKSTDEEQAATEYVGCTDIKGVSHHEIQVYFDFPEDASMVTIERNGVPVFYADDKVKKSFIDTGLLLNSTYEYTCIATIDDKQLVGTNLVSSSPLNPFSTLDSFKGCLSGKAISATSAEIVFEFPETIETMSIYRNGSLVSVSEEKNTTLFYDTELQEGYTYTYVCEGKIGEVTQRGSEKITVSTTSSNPPQFDGIVSATANGSSSVKVTWGVTSGVPLENYKVYGAIGSDITFIPTELLETIPAALEAIIDGIGDELPYTFGVLACSKASVCSGESEEITVTLPDRGAPTSPGLSNVAIVNSVVELTVPWEPSYGVVANRVIYRKEGAASSDISDYSEVSRQAVVDPLAPEEKIYHTAIAQYTTYHYVVRDIDANNQESSNVVFKTIATGDLSAPTFSGLNSLSKGSAGMEDTTLTVHFNAIDSDAVDPADGASHYLVYVKPTPGDACMNGTFHEEFSADPYTVSPPERTYVISNLLSRTEYSVCLKARDAFGNISATSSEQSRSTLDLTPPVFNGLASLLYNSSLSRFDLSWTASTATDLDHYNIKVWKNTAAPTAGEITTMTHSVASGTDGGSFTTTDFAYTDNDKVYAIVEACDDGNSIEAPDGASQCSVHSLGSAQIVQLTDITPPSNFPGVRPGVELASDAEGELTVKWYEPTDDGLATGAVEAARWPEYRGFRIYDYDTSLATPDLVKLKDCNCANTDCSDKLVQCTVGSLVPFKTYRIHVRAYDTSMNLTDYLAKTSFSSIRTSDETAPTFVPSLSIGYNSGEITLDWNAATDNQYSSEPGANISYNVYKRMDTTFPTPTSPAGGELYINTSSLTLVDSALTAGKHYYYTVCAVDASNNERCPGDIQDYLIADPEPPTIDSFTLTLDSGGKTWDLAWTMSDNITIPTNMDVSIRSMTSASSTPSANVNDYTTFVDGGQGLLSKDDLGGPINQDIYVHFLLTIKDAAENEDTATVSVYSQNLITVDTLFRDSGPLAGGRIVVIKGNGFDSTVSVDIGGSECTGLSFVSTTTLVCTAPAGSLGPAMVTVSSSASGSVTNKAGGYSYYNWTGAPGESLCDDPTQPTNSFKDGTGIISDPYLICTKAQLEHIRTITNSTGNYFELGDNIDLQSVSMAPLTGDDGINFQGTFDGAGFFIANFTYKNAGESNVALFGRTPGVTIKDLGLINVDLEGNGKVAGLIGEALAQTIVQDVFVSGTIKAHADYSGGVIGYGYHAFLLRVHADVNIDSIGNQSVGGIIGSHNYASAGALEDCMSTGTVVGDSFVGGLVGETFLNVSRSYSTMTVEATSSVGGLVGYSQNRSIIDSFFAGSVKGATGSIGGLAGNRIANIARSYVSGHVECGSGLACGGLAGYPGLGANHFEDSYFDGTMDMTNGGQRNGGIVGLFPCYGAGAYIKNTYSTGTITGTSSYIGGLVGFFICSSGDGTLLESYSDMSVSGSSRVAGLVGHVYGGGPITIDQSYFSGTLPVGSSGLISSTDNLGDNTLTIKDSYSNSEITTVSGTLSGAFGGFGNLSNDIVVTNVYAAGVLNKGVGSAHGLLPGPFTGTLALTSSYWDTESTGTSTSDFGVGKTTAEMKQEATFTGWDFTNIWEIDEDTTYPTLRMPSWDFTNVWIEDPVNKHHKLRHNSWDYTNVWQAVPGGHPVLK